MAKSLGKMKAKADAPEQDKVSFGTRLKRLYRILQKEKNPEKKAFRPRGYHSRKFGVYAFWIIFCLTFLISISAYNHSRLKNVSAEPVEQAVTLNPATTTTAVQYAQNFTKEYFTWKPDDKSLTNRKERLSSYLAKGLDEQGGLQISGLKTTSTLVKTEIKNIEEKGKNQAYVTLKVYQKVGIPKEITKINPKTKQKKVISTKYTPKEVTKFFVIPVGYAENYGIYDLPKFTYINPQTTLKVGDQSKGLKDVEITESKQNVRNFLDTFFSAYATDTKDKLTYLLEDPNHPNGLNQRMKFVSVSGAEIFQGDSASSYIVFAHIVLEDPDTKDQYKTNYKLNITQKDSRYVVSKIDEN